MKYYSETRNYVSRSLTSLPIEDTETRTAKHEISEAAFKLYTEEIYSGIKPLKNSDGSITFTSTRDSNNFSETTFWIEA